MDAIAERAKANKQMIYHYFGNKQDLYLAVLEEAYGDIRNAEDKLDLEHLDPVQALKKLVTFTWDYYLKNPEFLTLVNNENLHKAAHLRRSRVIGGMHSQFRTRLADILARGVRQTRVPPGRRCRPAQSHHRRHRLLLPHQSLHQFILYKTNLVAPLALQRRLDFNLETILRMVGRDTPRKGSKT